MMNLIKNILSKFGKQSATPNYVVAEYHAVKKKKAKLIDPIAEQFETQQNDTGEYMKIDNIHQKN